MLHDKEIKTAWATRYVKGAERMLITNSARNAYSGSALQVSYPRGGVGTGPSGAQWETHLKVEAEELYMSYWAKFRDDFDFVNGGKLPGLAGSTRFPHRDLPFSTRLMWRDGGKIEFYLHGYNTPYTYRVYWDDFGTHKRFVPGKWHHVEMHIKLNTPGRADGVLQGWLDGVLSCDDSANANVRAAAQSKIKLNHLFFSTFFGGTSDVDFYASKKDEEAYFDEFKISRERIGYPGPR